ncbi:unnamed protein product [Prorocentrum cordatum]|uniref:JmjC domain-containing protein n=1 Tax=Prorocentrum cordatum TaxID=2364126 RepID=A0ABN9XPI2_9DINO|nr:unnamed protein product [Polarella glacialis]
MGAKSDGAPPPLTQHRVRRCTCQQMQRLLQAEGGWRGLREPVVFDAPALHGQPFASREEILSPGFRKDFPTVTVLSDALAAQFGPDWLVEGQTFQRAVCEHCFTQVDGASAEAGPLRELYDALPEWMRCPMVVVSTGPGGSGVAFHKHSSAWLALVEGRKHWWLYPPGGPPSMEAYRAVALCPAARLAEAVEGLRPADRPVQITQRPGEAVFVPALWWHATYDTGPTLGIGAQFHVLDLDDFPSAVREHPSSAFVLYHYGCERSTSRSRSALPHSSRIGAAADTARASEFLLQHEPGSRERGAKGEVMAGQAVHESSSVRGQPGGVTK